MNALHQAQNAYGGSSQPIRTDRESEYEVFARVTHRLQAATMGGHGTMPELARAIHDNRRLWATLAADVAGSGNRLTADLRARLLYLAEFTRVHSSRVLAGASAAPLIDVNVAVMRGLRPRSETR